MTSKEAYQAISIHSFGAIATNVPIVGAFFERDVPIRIIEDAPSFSSGEQVKEVTEKQKQTYLIAKSFGELLRERGGVRQECKESLRQEVGMDRRKFNKWHSGECSPKIDEDFFKICRVLDLNLEDIESRYYSNHCDAIDE